MTFVRMTRHKDPNKGCIFNKGWHVLIRLFYNNIKYGHLFYLFIVSYFVLNKLNSLIKIIIV